MKYFIQLIYILALIAPVLGQNIIEPPKDYTNDIGDMVSILNDLKSRITRIVSNLSQKQTDFLMDENSNRIGAMILHLAATEVYYQKYTFENRQLKTEESNKWQVAQNLVEVGRQELVGKPISYYLDIWSQVREEAKRLLKTKDDTWFKEKNRSMNNN